MTFLFLVGSSGRVPFLEKGGLRVSELQLHFEYNSILFSTPFQNPNTTPE